MKFIALLITLGALLAGCAAMEEAYYVDREYGAASNDAFDRQIIYKDYVHAAKPVEGLPALHAESIMEAYHGTFSQSFTKESFDISEIGVIGGN